MKNTVLVTGGLGYIGSHTVVELLKAGFEVVIIDNLSNSRIQVLDGIKKITGISPSFEKLDLIDKESVKLFFLKYPDITNIIHFAASKAVGESVEKPLLYYNNNISTLLNILNELAINTNINFIFSSSCTVYGEPDKLPINEASEIKKAMSPYGNTKQIAEEILFDLCLVNPIFNVIPLRYFNPIGAHESAEIGELPIGPPQNLVPYITQTGIGLRDQLQVYGNDYPTKDGTCIRDYIHVVDLAKAHVKALMRLLNKENIKNYEVFNLGTGKGNSVLEVIKTFEKISVTPLNYKIVNRRVGDVVATYADTKKANTILKWKSELSLEDAIQSAWNWEKKQFKNI